MALETDPRDEAVIDVSLNWKSQTCNFPSQPERTQSEALSNLTGNKLVVQLRAAYFLTPRKNERYQAQLQLSGAVTKQGHNLAPLSTIESVKVSGIQWKVIEFQWI